METGIININDLENVLKIVELQRDLSVRLYKLKKEEEERLEELKRIKVISSNLAELVRKERQLKSWISLNDEEKKVINKLLVDRHIKI